MQPYIGEADYGYISFFYNDKDRVGRYIDILQKDGFRFWMDLSYDDIDESSVGNIDEQTRNIPTIIKQSKFFMAFITKLSANSMNVRNEISYAIMMGKEVAVVFLDEILLPNALKQMLMDKKSISLYECVDLEEAVNSIKRLCPVSICTSNDDRRLENELKELLLEDTNINENCYVLLKRIDLPSKAYRAAINNIITVGRNQPNNDINIEDKYVARCQCEIKLYDGELFIKDSNSTNRTLCDGKLVRTDSFEKIVTNGKYRIGKYTYSILLEREKTNDDNSGTVFFREMFEEFQEFVEGEHNVSTKELLMDKESVVNQKFNEAFKKWHNKSASRYIIDFLCGNLGIKLDKERRYRIYEELNIYNNVSNLSNDTMNDILFLSNLLIDFAMQKLNKENAWQYREFIEKYLNPKYVSEKIIEYDNDFVLYFLTPIFELDEDELGYILKHVLKRKWLDLYNPSEYLLWITLKVETDSKIGLLAELNNLYIKLKSTDDRSDGNLSDDDMSVTVYIGYDAEDNYLEKLDGKIDSKSVSNSDVVVNMLRRHINIEKKSGSSATVRFYELYREINALYSSEIADVKVMKNNSFDADNTTAVQTNGSRGSYNVSVKYDGTGKIVFKYKTTNNVILPAEKAVFESRGRFNRVDGKNDFALAEDVEIKAGSGEITLIVKCVSENPFQMAKLRKKGTASIAEKDSIRLNPSYFVNFEKVDVTNKPICIFFDRFKSTGDIREYLYSGVDRKDLFDEWFYENDKLSVDLSLLEADWFIESRLTDEVLKNFDLANEYEQRCGILIMLYMKFCKENYGSELSYQKLIKKFSKIVDYEMYELRLDGFSFGNPFDCLLCYLLTTSSPVDNLRLLYKEAFL